ncbi:thioredoxin [Thermococcus kodakarensis KOD1]|uniref:Thioredoxin n=1 Tax=Thermococcus kodakarensis (strain ATCC BAA-918 / JCM 12380 / KOD1) TaxID=69014 RepID=Q5JDF3_THEKO|nr:thioredoxin family protein [Thermococcus kodakarensis]WCN29232.1 thioredoxin family protein [Thermococcus kodakarensis]WCN31146.1 thioredoxin family protein [Thermococcus kodakarensis]BAD85027.1 thioredoxin [Thermococcus kodakarensis KOD1]
MIVEYDENVDFTKGKAVLWFSIPGCPPCRLVEAFMKELSEEFGEIAIVHVNAEKWSGLVEGFRILNVPTLVYLKDGKEVARQNLIRGKGEVLIKFEEPREL